MHRPGHGPNRGPQKQKVKNPKKTITRLWQYLAEQKKEIIIVFVLVAVSTLGSLMGPFLMGKAIDLYIIQGDIPGLAKILLLMTAVYLLTAFFRWLQQYIMIGVSQKTLKNLRDRLFKKFQILSLKFFDKRTHGELMSRVTNDIENINVVMTQSVIQFIESILSISGILVIMVILNYQLTIITLLTIPVIIVFTKFMTKYTRKNFKKRQKNLGELNGNIEENITGQKVVKIYCQEEDTKKEFNDINEKFRLSAIKARIFANVLPPIMNLMNNINFALIAGLGGWLTINGLATVGTVAAFLNYIRRFNRPIRSMAGLYNNIQSALAGAERVFAVLDKQPELQDKPGAIPVDKIEGNVKFSGVTFGYEEDEKVLKNVNFETNRGEMVALVGPTGAGKTTIINLLTRFYDIDEGRISIDDRDIKDYKIQDLRARIGIVLQDTYLFSDTVRENIRYGRLDATDEEVERAAELANASHFIKHLPEGYDTRLKEEASNLSQGQRQLLSIARTILADPDILILDEATSSIDTRTEKHIQQAMKNLMKDRTSFVIAHRLSTIESADNILVIRDGEIIEKGSHQELLQQRGFYHNLYYSQFQDADAV
ncbi:MAG: ABC transporter ATP-binding protein [Halanaerobiaceae bacterium]